MVVMRKNEIYEFKYEFRTQVMRKKLREVPSFGMPSAHANSVMTGRQILKSARTS